MRLVTLAEHYGMPTDETVPDQQWLELAGTRGWAVFMKDTRIRYNPAEREAVKTHSVRCFCLSSQSLTGDAMALRFLDNLTRITAACEQPGPYIYAVHKNRIEELTLSNP